MENSETMRKLPMMLVGIAIGLCLIVAMAVSMFACSPARSATLSSADAIAAKQVATMLDGRLYKVDFTHAYPSSGPSFPLNYPYYVSIIDDRVESYLPYLGRAYMIPYGGGEGLRFRAPIGDYNMTTGRRGQYEISFTARTSEDDYVFYLDIYPTGESDLRVSSTRKQAISFRGTVDLDPEFESVRIK